MLFWIVKVISNRYAVVNHAMTLTSSLTMIDYEAPTAKRSNVNSHGLQTRGTKPEDEQEP